MSKHHGVPTKTAVATLIAFIAFVTATILLNRPHSTLALHAETIVTHYETGRVPRLCLIKTTKYVIYGQTFGFLGR